MPCTCPIVGAEYDDRWVDPACPNHGAGVGMVDCHLVSRDSNYLDVLVIEIKDAAGNLVEMRVSEPELCSFEERDDESDR